MGTETGGRHFGIYDGSTECTLDQQKVHKFYEDCRPTLFYHEQAYTKDLPLPLAVGSPKDGRAARYVIWWHSSRRCLLSSDQNGPSRASFEKSVARARPSSDGTGPFTVLTSQGKRQKSKMQSITQLEVSPAAPTNRHGTNRTMRLCQALLVFVPAKIEKPSATGSVSPCWVSQHKPYQASRKACRETRRTNGWVL